MLTPTPAFVPDFNVFIEQVHAATHANGGQQAEALRVVIERYHLSDYDGVRLCSAVMKAMRETYKAA